MRFTLTAVFLAAVFASPLAAQSRGASRVDVAVGYSLLHDQDISQNLPRGWVASVADNLTSWLGIVGTPLIPPSFTLISSMHKHKLQSNRNLPANNAWDGSASF